MFMRLSVLDFDNRKLTLRFIVHDHVVRHHTPMSTPHLLVSKSCDNCTQVSPLLLFCFYIMNVEHCGGEPEQEANMHMNRLSFTLK